MLLDKKLKRKLLLTLAIAMVAEVFIVMPLIRSTELSSQLWRSTLGALVVITGIAISYVVTILPLNKDDKLLKSAIIANPGIVMILSGIGVIVWNDLRFEWLFLICSFGAVAVFFISFTFLARHLMLKKEQSKI